MNATKKLHDVGQSLWLDNITRDLLDNGTLKRYIAELSVTGLTSNPTIFNLAFKNSKTYDGPIADKVKAGMSGEDLFFSLAIEDLNRAADQFKSIFENSNGVDGWVSLEVSPELAHDTGRTVAAAKALHSQAHHSNLFIKIPGTPEGLPAIEEAIFAGVPVNVTLLFSADHYVAAAEAYLRGIERRIAAGLNPEVGSVASVFVSRWDGAVAKTAPAELVNKLGIAVGQDIYKAYNDMLSSSRWRRINNAGAHGQRLLWASTGTKDPNASDVMYIKALASPFTVNTMPENTLLAFGDHGDLGDVLASDGVEGKKTLAEFKKAGIDVPALAAKLQDDGASSFVASWKELMGGIDAKTAAAKAAA